MVEECNLETTFGILLFV